MIFRVHACLGKCRGPAQPPAQNGLWLRVERQAERLMDDSSP